MGEYDPITKGLRERLARLPIIDKTEDELTDLCDSIDTIHRSLERENKEMFDFCDRLKAASEYREDVTLYGVDYIPVPLDKDGVPIHIGDVMGHQGLPNVRYTVVGISEDLFFTRDASGLLYEHTAVLYFHYKPDTWESIIEDATKLGFTDPDNEHLRDKLVSRCKALCERTKGDA